MSKLLSLPITPINVILIHNNFATAILPNKYIHAIINISNSRKVKLSCQLRMNWTGTGDYSRGGGLIKLCEKCLMTSNFTTPSLP